MPDSILLITPAVQPVQTADPAAVFGKHSVSAYSQMQAYSKAEPILRPNLYGLSFGMGMSWFLLLSFVVFVFLSHYKKIAAPIFSLIAFRRSHNVNHPFAQQWLTNFAFVFFVLVSLALLAANVWHLSYTSTALGFAFAGALGSLLVYFLAKYVLCFTIEVVSQQRMFTFNLFTANVNAFFAMCFLLIPLFLAQTLVPDYIGGTLIYAQAVVVGVFLAVYFLRTIAVFLHNKISLFFWLLYFTAIEILPLAVFYKIMTGS